MRTSSLRITRLDRRADPAVGRARRSALASRRQTAMPAFSSTVWIRISPSLLAVLADVADAVAVARSAHVVDRGGLARRSRSLPAVTRERPMIALGELGAAGADEAVEPDDLAARAG